MQNVSKCLKARQICVSTMDALGVYLVIYGEHLEDLPDTSLLLTNS